MALSSLDNILGKHMFPNFLSKNHVLYFPEAVGVITSGGLPQPNVDEYERKGWGVDGIAYREQTFRDQPWSMEIEHNEAFNRFVAIVSDQNPYDAESEETTGVDPIAAGGCIALTDNLDIVVNQRDRSNSKFVKSLCYFNSTKNKMPVDIPNEGSSKVSLSGTATRGYQFNKPAFLEGWGHLLSGSALSTPDDTITLSSGCVWLRRSTGSDWTPKKCFYKGGTPFTTGTISPVTADARYSSLVAYESTKEGYSDLDFLLVDGTETSSPTVPSDSECETQVDAISSGARWCRLFDIYVDETTSVIIDQADIQKGSLESNTLNFVKTALALTSAMKKDPFFFLDYLIYLKIDGMHKSNKNNILSDSPSSLIFSSKIQNLIEVVYLIEPAAQWNPLSA